MPTIYPRVMFPSIPLGILPAGLLSTMMRDMDESPTRVARLQSLIDGERFTTQAALAARLEVQPDYLSRMFKGLKRLSGDMAREYEERLGLPKYWLDGDNVPHTTSAKALEVAKCFDRLTASQQEAVVAVLESYAGPVSRPPTQNDRSEPAQGSRQVQKQSSGSS
jgi:hypothetical protein